MTFLISVAEYPKCRMRLLVHSREFSDNDEAFELLEQFAGFDITDNLYLLALHDPIGDNEELGDIFLIATCNGKDGLVHIDDARQLPEWLLPEDVRDTCDTP